MTFQVGQKMCCVDDSLTCLGYKTRLVKGAVYTVQSVNRHTGGVTLVEVPTSILIGHNLFFRRGRFRPVVKTDISIFTKMLTDVKDKVKA